MGQVTLKVSTVDVLICSCREAKPVGAAVAAGLVDEAWFVGGPEVVEFVALGSWRISAAWLGDMMGMTAAAPSTGGLLPVAVAAAVLSAR